MWGRCGGQSFSPRLTVTTSALGAFLKPGPLTSGSLPLLFPLPGTPSCSCCLLHPPHASALSQKAPQALRASDQSWPPHHVLPGPPGPQQALSGRFGAPIGCRKGNLEISLQITNCIDPLTFQTHLWEFILQGKLHEK